LDYLYYADGEAWVVGATFGGPRVGIVNFERKICPYQVPTEVLLLLFRSQSYDF
jgi:hypothetical protein